MFHLLGNCIFSVYVIWRCFNEGVVMETLEQLKEIESNQPEDGTAQIYDGEYWKQAENLVFYVWSNVRGFYEWVPDAPKDLYNLRSLSDIKRIIELMEDVSNISRMVHIARCGIL